MKKFVLTVSILMLVVSFSMAQGAPAQASANSGAAAAAAGRQVVLDDLPQLTAPERQTRVEIPMRGPLFDRSVSRGVPLSSPEGVPSPRPGESGVLTSTPVTNKSFLGEGEVACGSFIPSDQALATNGSAEVQVINSCITVYNTGGTRLTGYPKSLNAFFGIAGDSIGDPRALFDWKSSRWIVMAEDFTANNILVAASDGSSPTGSYHIYTLSGTSGGFAGCADFPMLGQTVNEIGDAKGAIYVSFDRFNCTSGAFIDDIVWILPKTPIYAGGGFGFNIFFNLNVSGVTVDHVQPANVMNKGDQPDSEFLINTFDFNGGNGGTSGCFSFPGCNGLVVWAIHHGIGGGSALTGSVIGTANNYAQPYTAAQPGAASGSACAINPGFVGIAGGVTWSAGDLYAATTTANFTGNPANGWIYWQVHPYLNGSGNMAGAKIRNEIGWGINGFSGDGTYSQYYPTPQPDDEGNVTVVFNISSDVLYPSTSYISQRTTQPTGGFPDGGFYLAVGSAFYCQLDQFGRNRWGDYTATSPFGPTVEPYPEFWFAGQYSVSGNWGTKIGKNGYSTPAAQ